MKKYLFIINPIAGNGKAKAMRGIIEEVMDENQIDYKIVYTSKPKEATYIASSYDFDVVVAVGGDGTVNEVTAGLIDREGIVLGIIPAGTGNDLCRNLNLPLDPKEAIERILEGKVSKIPVGQSNGHIFLNISSVGFDVAVLINHEIIRKKLKGKLSYIIAVIYTLFKYQKDKVIIDIEGEIYHRNLFLLAIGKGKYYGGGMMIIPNSNPYDDYLYVCLVKDVSNLRVLTLFPLIFKGRHLGYTKYVETFKAKNIKIINKSPCSLNVDGEILVETSEINFQLIDKKISIIT